MEKQKIGFEDLTLSLKVLVVIGWIIAVIYILAFMVGFAIGLTSV